MFKKNKKFLLMFLLVITLLLPVKILAKAFPSSIGNIYELRDKNAYFAAYTGGVITAGRGGVYLGTATQFLPYKVSALTLQEGTSGVNAVVSTYEDILYCTMFGAKSPALNSYTATSGGTVPSSCTIDTGYTTWNKDRNIAVAIAAIINFTSKNYTKDGTFAAGYEKNLEAYYDAEIAINRFLHENLVQNPDKNTSCYINNSACTNGYAYGKPNKITTYNENLVKLANEAYHAVEAFNVAGALTVNKPISTKLTYSNDAEAFVSEKFDVTNIDKYDPTTLIKNVPMDKQKSTTAVLKDSTGKVYNGYAYLTRTQGSGDTFKYQVNVCSNNTSENCKNYKTLPAGNYIVDVTFEGKASYEVAQNYICGAETEGFQTITPGFTDTITKEEKETLQFTFTIDAEKEEETGTIIINKIDTDTGRGLKGATIKVVGKDVSYNKTYILSASTTKTLKYLELGTYEITEVKAPDGYEKDTKTYTVTLTEDDTSEALTIKNKKIESSVTIKKLDSETKKVIPGAKMQIIDSEGKTVYEIPTNNNGTITYSKLPEGKYYVIELEAPAGYALSKEKVEFEITSTKRTVTVEFKNTPEIKVPDTLSNISKIFIICGIVGIIAGAYLVYNNAKKQESV